jgi:hypothetical protein
MPIVNYGRYLVSDERLRDALERIADELGHVVRVTSGDRDSVPKGGAQNSLHLVNMAVDFHVEVLTDDMAFNLMRLKRQRIFGNAKGKSFRYQIIYHGPFTETGGEHLHLGYVPETQEKRSMGFLVEGLTSSTKGYYQYVETA